MIVKRPDLHLLLAYGTVISMGALWWPVPGLFGFKMHQVFGMLLVGVTFLLPQKRRQLFEILNENKILTISFVSIIFGGAVLSMAQANSWSSVKIISFGIQLCFSLIAAKEILASPERLRLAARGCFITFFLSLFVLSGLPILSVVKIFGQGIATANPKIIIIDFLAKAPAFQALGEDGLDGLRHTISILLVTLFYIEAFLIRNRTSFFIGLFLVAMILLLQSRSAWLAFAYFLLTITAFTIWQKHNTRAMLFIVPAIIVIGAGAMIKLIPLLLARLTDSRSYSERGARLTDAFDHLAELPWAPVSLDRVFGSSHTFFFDAMFNYGIWGFANAIVFTVAVGLLSLPRLSKSNYHIGMINFVLFVRLCTAGSGLPGAGAALALGLGLALRSKVNRGD